MKSINLQYILYYINFEISFSFCIIIYLYKNFFNYIPINIFQILISMLILILSIYSILYIDSKTKETAAIILCKPFFLDIRAYPKVILHRIIYCCIFHYILKFIPNNINITKIIPTPTLYTAKTLIGLFFK